MTALIELLHQGDYSCVIQNGDTRVFNRKGVADIYTLLENEPEFLRGSQIADKIVGKAAAALMILGNVKSIYADIISEPALELLREADVPVDFARIVPFIRNRDNTGWCPLETACHDKSITDILSVIAEKVNVKKFTP